MLFKKFINRRFVFKEGSTIQNDWCVCINVQRRDTAVVW